MTQPLHSERLSLTASLIPGANRSYACALLAAGPLKGHNLHVSAAVLQRDAHKFANVPAHVDHHWFPQVATLVGLHTDVRYDAKNQAVVSKLTLKSTPAAAWLSTLIDELIADQDNGDPALNIGLSADLWLEYGPPDGIGGMREILAVRGVSSVDIVINPASDGARFDRILAQAGHVPAQSTLQEVPMSAPVPVVEPAETATPPAPTTPVPAQVAPTPAPIQAAAAPAPVTPFGPQGDIAAEFAALRQQFSDLAARQAITGFDTPRPQPITAAQMNTPADDAQAIVDWLFGVHAAALPEPTMRQPRNFYGALTGDFDWTGRLHTERAQFASANTVSLADLAANAMNKVLVQAWPALQAYRWFEPLVTVTPNDGSVHPMAWIQFGGIGNLPQVDQGGTYTELNVADSRENDPFAKYGGFVGVTVEMWRNNDMQRMQSIPRALAVAAVRTRSAAIASIFTANNGTGPVLDDDGTVLFHSTHGGNVQTTAFSLAAWTAADLECFNQPELGSDKPIGLSPKFALVPKALLVPALVAFGYGAGTGGYPGTSDNDTNPYAEPNPWLERPVPVVVPDWTDANDWAYLVDKNLQPVIMMTYAQNPGGGAHPMPELFSVASPTAGLVFTNDVLPIKVRDWFAYGVAGWRGIGKRNVA